MNDMKNKELIDRLLNYYKETVTEFNKETCINEFVIPIFKSLGFDVTNIENLREVAVFSHIVENTNLIADINEMINAGVTRVQQSILHRTKQKLIRDIEDRITDICLL